MEIYYCERLHRLAALEVYYYLSSSDLCTSSCLVSNRCQLLFSLDDCEAIYGTLVSASSPSSSSSESKLMPGTRRQSSDYGVEIVNNMCLVHSYGFSECEIIGRPITPSMF